MFKYIFSIAFIFTLCLFWMQIQIGKCEDDLQFWVRDSKYWTTTTTVKWSTGRRDLRSQTEKDTPRRKNVKFEKSPAKALDGFLESELESNQVNSIDEVDDGTQADRPDNLLYWVDSDNGKNSLNHRAFTHITYSEKKDPEPTHSSKLHRESHSHHKGSKTVNKHNEKVHPNRIHSSTKTSKSFQTHSKNIATALNFEENSKEVHNWKPLKTKNKTKKHSKVHKSKVSKNHLKAPLVEHSTYKEIKKTEKSDLESEVTVKPVTEAKTETEDSDELSTESNTNSIYETKTKPALETTTESAFEAKIESAFHTKMESAFETATEKEKKEKQTTPLREGSVHMINDNSSSSSEPNSKEKKKNQIKEDQSEVKTFYVHKNVKWPGRSPLHKPGDSSHNTPSKNSDMSSLEYLSPHSIRGQLECLAKKFEAIASIDQEVIGRTVEYNDIILWKIKELPDNRKGFKHKTYRYRARGSKYADDKPEKKIVFIVHGLNVMGWHKIKCLSQVKRFETLLGYYFDNLDCFDIFLIPMANPDGVHMSGTQGYWNKNVSPQKACPGVNLDRNFDVGWNASYAKISSCSQQFPGPRVLSEHETKAVRDVFNRYGHKMIAFFHVHSSTYDTTVYRGDAVLYPKGYTDAQTDDDRYVDFKGELDEAMRNTSFKVLGVTVDTLHSWYGKVIGTSVDYASTVFGIPYSFDFSMQIYDDDTMVSDEDDREQNTALVELWQIVIDVLFSHIHNNTEKIDA